MNDSTNQPAKSTAIEPLSGHDIASTLQPEQLDKAKALVAQIKTEDSQAILTFGIGAQKEISTFANSVLEHVRAKDSGYVGDILTSLVTDVKGLNVDGLNKPKKGLAKLFSNATNAIKRFMMQYDHLSTQIDKIVDQLDQARISLLHSIALMDNMFTMNAQYLDNLDIFIAAGEMKLAELNGKILPQAKIKAETSNDPLVVQAYQDLIQFVNRFERKVHDLKLSRMIAIQTAPQIRLIQTGDQALVEKVQNSILTTIPLWKQQIVIAIEIFKQKKALETQRLVTDTTNDILKKNSQMLKTGTIEVAKENERGIVELETLKQTNADLISTIEETIKIQQEGHTKRMTAEQELTKLESDLKNTLKTI